MWTPDSHLDIQRFKTSIVDGVPSKYSYGRKANLNAHLEMLKTEFSGKTYLEFFHATTITFIRRNLNQKHCISNFQQIWEQESEFLCERLDSRWLVSACDTIIDHYTEADEVATAIAATLFMNTCKLYETERLKQNTTNKFLGVFEIFNKNSRIPLFDGLSAFDVVNGDMINNLLDRISEKSKSRIASPILKELIRRANTYDTVFKRFHDVHKDNKTRWRKE